MIPIPLRWSLLALAACANAPVPAPLPPEHAAARAALRDDATSADLDRALSDLDRVAARCADDPDYHGLRGELTLALAERTRGAGGRGADLLLLDAIAALQRAVAAEPSARRCRRLLAQALLANGEPAPAAAIAAPLVAAPGASAGSTPRSGERTAELAVALRATAAAVVHAPPAGGARVGELIERVRAVGAALEAADALDDALLAAWSASEAAAGDPAAAIDVHVRAVAARPADGGRLGALVEAAAAHAQLPRALAALRDARDPTRVWYRGRVHFLLADALDLAEPAGRAAALAELDAASACFTAAREQLPVYADSCAQWLALCTGKKGTVAFAAGDLDRAEAWLLAAARARPDLIDTSLGRGDTIKLALLRLGDRTMRDFARTEALFRAAADAVGGDVDLLNNAAVYARDLGTRLARAGRTDAALAMFERSYTTYGRAVQADPASVRLRNDCALVAIHHLGRDWERSRELLLTAIRDGEAQLRDDPPADAKAREELDEAVGDGYENLALWHLRHSGDSAAARSAATQSLAHHPRERRTGALRHLQEAEARSGAK